MFRPINNKILVKPYKTQRKVGRFVIPEQYQRSKPKGRIIRVASNVKNLHEGDDIMFRSNNVHDILLEGEHYCLLDKSDVLGVMKKCQ